MTIKSHQTYTNLTDAFFKQRLLSIFEQCCERAHAKGAAVPIRTMANERERVAPRANPFPKTNQEVLSFDLNGAVGI